MIDWRKISVRPEAHLAEVIVSFDLTGVKICLVVNETGCLVGTVTDGDIRRAVLRSVPLNATAAEIMNRDPVFANAGDTADRIRKMTFRRPLRQIPVLDDERKIVGLVDMDVLHADPQTKSNWVVLMAGGRGNRLRPLTDKTPKPMLTLGGKPVLEIIVERLATFGFKKFYISVNYKSSVVKDYFGDGSQKGIEIAYLEETTRLGTAGALNLLPEIPKDPLLVMNADLLTSIDFTSLLVYHHENADDATMCVREYEMNVPYGVVSLNGTRIESIDEKPIHRFFVNAGIYVLEPKTLAYIAKGGFFDMPDLFARIVADGGIANAFPIREHWIDIGRKEDLDCAMLMVEESNKGA